MKKIYLLGYKKKDSDRRYMREISLAMFLQIQSDISDWICKNMAIKKIYLIYLLTKSCCEAFFFFIVTFYCPRVKTDNPEGTA